VLVATSSARRRARALPCLLLALAAILAAAAPAWGAGGGYRVRPGDTLSGIAVRLGVSASDLARANALSDPDRIVAGRRLTVPGRAAGTSSGGGGGAYRVRSGDTLSGIAVRLGVSTGALVRANRLTDPNRIVVGRRLVLPGGAPAAAGTTGTASSYRVRPGDTLSGIAARLGVSGSSLAGANGLADPNRIVVGALLRLPGGAASPASPATPAWVDPGIVPGLIARSAAVHGVDPALVRAVAWQESGFQQAMRSPVGALGVMQIMPETAEWLGPALLGRRIDASQVQDNVEAGVSYLAWLLRHAGSVEVAVAGYYQGLRSVRERGMYGETRQYVENVLSLRGRV
jgi:LysM repeat protein